MGLTIHKYPLEAKDRQFLMLPRGARILSVAEQRGRLCLWALVDPEKETVMREVQIRGTGHSVEFPVLPEGVNNPPPGCNRLAFVGTVLLARGDLVLHVFADLI